MKSAIFAELTLFEARPGFCHTKQLESEKACDVQTQEPTFSFTSSILHCAPKPWFSNIRNTHSEPVDIEHAVDVEHVLGKREYILN